MSIDMEQRSRIKKEAIFLNELGYIITEDEYSINYSLKNHTINIVFPPNTEEGDILIRFLDLNQVFSIGWIAFVRNNFEGESEKTENVIALIKYVKVNYGMIINYRYCLQSDKLIHEYVKQHRTQFEKSVADFLENA